MKAFIVLWMASYNNAAKNSVAVKKRREDSLSFFFLFLLICNFSFTKDFHREKSDVK